ISRKLISERSGDDRGVKWIALTPKGKTALARAEAGWLVMQRATIEVFGAEAAASLLANLAELSSAVDAAGNSAHQARENWKSAS
ncbi:MAG: hypothetical protein HKN60_02545, partial [Rhizobiales bacterium]|nr:hypothetical protein [Hyphomicrobiales bacterium]